MASLIVVAPTPGHQRPVAAFLAYLVLITFAPVHHGIRVLETRGEPSKRRTWFHSAVNVAMIVTAVAMVGLASDKRQPVFAALSPIGLLVGLGNLRFARRPYRSHMSWWYEHMRSMLAGGIAFHTAFLVIGAGRLFAAHLTGAAAVIPWVLPSVIGIPAMRPSRASGRPELVEGQDSFFPNPADHLRDRGGLSLHQQPGAEDLPGRPHHHDDGRRHQQDGGGDLPQRRARLQ